MGEGGRAGSVKRLLASTPIGISDTVASMAKAAANPKRSIEKPAASGPMNPETE